MQALSHLHGVVEKRNTIPILANVLLEAKDKVLSLAATDMEIAEIESISCDILQEGSITTPAHVLYDIVRKLPEGSEIQLGERAKHQKGLDLQMPYEGKTHTFRFAGGRCL